MYMYNWISLLYTWNIVNQLYFNERKKRKKYKKKKNTTRKKCVDRPLKVFGFTTTHTHTHTHTPNKIVESIKKKKFP